MTFWAREMNLTFDKVVVQPTSASAPSDEIGGGFYSSSGSGPSATYTFNATRGGSHDIWLRVFVAINDGDSLHIDLDGSVITDHLPTSIQGQWAWEKVRTATLSAGGQHTLTLWAREDGLKVDKIVIKPAGSTAPSGNGPNETGSGA